MKRHRWIHGMLWLLVPLAGAAGCGGGAGGREALDGAGPVPPVPPPRNVVIYLVDTLRASHMGLQGYHRPTSPRIDGFARSAVTFDAAYSSSPWTRTAVATLFTGLHPETHGVHDKEDVAPEDLLMLAEALRDAGLETGGFSSNISVSKKFRMAQGFDAFTFFDREDYFGEEHPADPGYVPVEGMLPEIVRWLDAPREKPFFLYIHTTDPHYRYLPPQQYRLWGSEKKDLYDGEILYTDDYFGRFIDQLDQRGILDETLVVFTADHGEELGDRGTFGHGHSLYNELLHVPLFFRYPGLATGRREEVVRMLDVFPTLAEWLDLPVDTASMQGRSLMPMLLGGADPQPELQYVLGQIRYPSKIVGESFQKDGTKIIHIASDRAGRRDVWELYDVRSDGAEKRNLSARRPDLFDDYRTLLARHQADSARQSHPTERTELDPKTEEVLRALGYIQ